MNPRVLREGGFKHLDRVVKLACLPPVSSASQSNVCSVRNTKFTQSSTCIPSPVDKIPTGIPTTLPATPHSGNTKTAPSGSGNNSP
jgi:hypothetical protein